MGKMKRFLSVILAVCLLVSALPGLYSEAAAVPGGVQEFANVVVFVQFVPLSKKNFVQGRENEIMEMWNGSSAASSFAGYLNAISYGRFQVHNIFPQYDPAGKTFTPYVVPDAPGDNDVTVIQSVIRQLNENGGLGNSQLDYNGDGAIDNLVVVADKPYVEDRENSFYSHKSDYPGSEKVRGRYVRTYNILNGYGVFDSILSKQGVISHEFLHSIGYPDLYRNGGEDSPVGNWDIMSSESIYMQYPLAYLRQAVSGWVNLSTVTESTKGLVLNSQELASGNHGIILKSPLSSSEFFVVEYRKQGNALPPGEITLDAKVYGSGLIIYRINTRAANLSNHYGGPDGVYVFRPGVTDEKYCGSKSSGGIMNSYLSSSAGRTSYGSTDFKKTIRDNTSSENIINFSDGSNSGIRIENVGAGGGDSITFDVVFGDSSKLDIWEVSGGGAVSGSSGQIVMASDENQNIYVAYDDNQYGNASLYLAGLGGSTWQSAAPAISGAYSGDKNLIIFRGRPCMFYTKAAGQNSSLYMSVLSGGTWSERKVLDNVYSGGFRAEAASDGLYITYITYTLDAVMGTMRAAYLQDTGSEPRISNIGALYSPSMTSDGTGTYVAARYASGQDIVVKKISGAQMSDLGVCHVGSNVNGVTIKKGSDGNLYLAAISGEGVKNLADIYRYEGNSWKKLGGHVTSAHTTGCSIDVWNGIPYVAAMESAGDANILSVYQYKNGSWSKTGESVDRSVDVNSNSDVTLKIAGGTAYIAYTNGSSAYVKCRQLSESGSVPEERKVTGISCKGPSKIKYIKGESLQTAGLSVSAVWSDGSMSNLSAGEYQISGFDTNKTGAQNVKIGYAKDSNISCYFTVTVEEKVSAPETEKPQTKPTETPQTEKPQTKPTEAPQMEKPQTKPTEAPQTEKPQTKPTEAPQTEKPQTKPTEAPQTEKPQTKPTEAPQTEQPQTNPAETPQTEIPQTEAPAINPPAQGGAVNPPVNNSQTEESVSSGAAAHPEAVTRNGKWKRNAKGWWYEYEDKGYPANQWALINGKYYHFNNRGYMQTGWLKLGKDWYYLQNSGAMATGWVKVKGIWYYLKNDGRMATGWQQVGNTWYYLKGSGAMATGWLRLGSNWYYLKSSGAMAVGWVKLKGVWYYLKPDGVMATGWQRINNTWYYLKNSGAMATGWQRVGGSWYYLKSSGAMATGWIRTGGKWYYLKQNGAMATGWIDVDGKKYFLDRSGAWVK